MKRLGRLAKTATSSPISRAPPYINRVRDHRWRHHLRGSGFNHLAIGRMRAEPAPKPPAKFLPAGFMTRRVLPAAPPATRSFAAAVNPARERCSSGPRGGADWRDRGEERHRGRPAERPPFLSACSRPRPPVPTVFPSTGYRRRLRKSWPRPAHLVSCHLRRRRGGSAMRPAGVPPTEIAEPTDCAASAGPNDGIAIWDAWLQRWPVEGSPAACAAAVTVGNDRREASSASPCRRRREAYAPRGRWFGRRSGACGDHRIYHSVQRLRVSRAGRRYGDPCGFDAEGRRSSRAPTI